MKASLSYKSKRNIIISAVIVVLVAAIGTGTYFFTKGNSDQASAFSDNGTQTGETSQTETQGNEGQEKTVNPEENQGEIVEPNLEQDGEENGDETTSSSTTTGNNGSTTNNGTTGTTTGDVPNQDYVTERIETEDVLVSEDYEVAWSPLAIEATTTTTELGIVRPIIVAEKATDNKEVVAGEEIEYTITVSNIGNLEGTAIVQDKAPEKTTFKADSIKINNEEAKHEDGSSFTEADLEAGIELSVKPEETITVSFVVTVNDKETITKADEEEEETITESDEDAEETVEIPTEGTIINTAVVNEEETNSVKNPILHIEKISEVYRNGELVGGDGDAAKVGDTIKYRIKVKNTSEELDVTTYVKDEAPEGTELVEDSISEGGVLAEDGTILWDEISLEKGEETEVSFSVTVNKDRTTSVENIAIVSDMPTNNVVNPVINVEAVKTSKADNPLYEKGMIEYNITLTNKGNAQGEVTVTDNVPEGTTLVPDSILVDGKASDNVTFEKDKNNLITWKDITVGTENSVVLSFKVTVNVFDTDTKNIINNTATLDGEPINPTTDESLRVYIDITGKKVWEDKSNAGNTRPANGITIQLKANGNVINSQIINGTGNEWEYEFKKQPKYDEQGETINYTVDELAVDGYAKNISGYAITNSLPNIQVEKSIYNLNGGAELDSKTILSVKAGDIVGYKITVTNTGDVDLTNVVVTDTMANGNTANSNKIYLTYQNAQNEANGTNTVANIAKLAINDSKTYIVYYKVKASDVKDANVNINNTAKAVGHFTNGDNKDETVEDTSDKVIVNIEKSPKITAVKERVGSGKVEPGNTITYKITVKNEGNTNLTNVKVFDTMNNNPSGSSRAVTITGLTVAGSSKTIPTKGSDGSYNIGSLAIGQTAVITATYKVTENDMAETEKTITNTAKAEGLSDGDVTVKSDESKVDVTTIVWKPIITLNKTSTLTKANPNSLVGSTTAEYGDTIKYTITATNTGRKAGTVVVKDYIPAGTELVAYSSSNGTTNLTQAEYNALKNATTSNKFSKTLSVEGNDGTNNGTTSIYFTVKVTAKPGEKVQNIATDGRDNSSVPEPGNTVEKVVSVTKNTETPVITGSNVLIILDTSYTMIKSENYFNYNGANCCRFDVARAVIHKFISEIDFSSGSQVSYITFNGPRNGKTTGTGYSQSLTFAEDNGGTTTIADSASEAYRLIQQSISLTISDANNTDNYSMVANPGTLISGALLRARDEMKNFTNTANKDVVIFVGDGNPEGDDATDMIDDYIQEIKNGTYNSGRTAEFYVVGFGETLDMIKNLTDASGNKLISDDHYFDVSDDDESENPDIVFNTIGTQISPATPVNVASSQGKITLTDVDTSKKVTITVNGGTPIERTATSTTYVINLQEFAANASIEIQYYKKN